MVMIVGVVMSRRLVPPYIKFVDRLMRSRCLDFWKGRHSILSVRNLVSSDALRWTGGLISWIL